VGVTGSCTGMVVVLACGHGVFVRNGASGRVASCWLVCMLAMGKPPRASSRFPPRYVRISKCTYRKINHNVFMMCMFIGFPVRSNFY